MEREAVHAAAQRPIAWYREFVPCAALRADVYALFSFVPERAAASPFRPLLREIAFRKGIACAPQLADGHVSMRFELGQACDAEGRWRVASDALGGTVIGPMSGVGRVGALDLSETVGAYFRPGGASRFFNMPVSYLTDTAVAAGDIWGTRQTPSSSDLAALNESARINRLESILLACLRSRVVRTSSVDVAGLATNVLRTAGRVTVEGMARAAGVSRQHLAREFREQLGIGPKLYTRIARFQSVLAHAGMQRPTDWARVALDRGFADQSHLIAECRQFSGLTPRMLAEQDWFHPFIERAKATFPASE